MLGISCCGGVRVPKRSTFVPVLSTRNLVKFLRKYLEYQHWHGMAWHATAAQVLLKLPAVWRIHMPADVLQVCGKAAGRTI